MQEFELISHESECMKRKLLSQEDEFRLQNETLMIELGQVSDVNDRFGSAQLLFATYFSNYEVQKNFILYSVKWVTSVLCLQHMYTEFVLGQLN